MSGGETQGRLLGAAAAAAVAPAARYRHRLGTRAWGAVGPRMEPPPPGAAAATAAPHAGEPQAHKVEGAGHDPMYPRPRA